MDMEELFMLLFSMLVMASIMWIVAAVLTKKRKAEDDAQPVLTQKAKLIEIQQITAGQIVLGEIPAMFELENGERVRLQVNPQNHLVVGDTGMLTWQGRRIISFERNK